MVKSHYETLGVPNDADANAIKKAYKKLAFQNHPDKCAGKDEEFKKISEAYQVLSDPGAKRKYDNTDPMFSSSFYQPDTSFFSSLFGGNMSGNMPGFGNMPVTNSNMNHKVLLTLEDFYTGKSCKFAISRKVQCKECQGEGGWGKNFVDCIGCHGQGVRVSHRGYNSVSRSTCMQCRGNKSKTVFEKICKVCKTIGVVQERVVAEAKFEAGARPGDKVILKGMSDCVEGRPAGDVIVTASEKSHRIFKRKNSDLKCSIDITLRQSLCGFSAEITHLDGRKVEVKSDGNVTPHGSTFNVQGEGIPRGKGCLEITTNVVFPKVVPESITAKLSECFDVIEKK